MGAEMLYRKMEELSLPTQAMGASLLEIIGGRQVLLTGQKGIRSYSASEIVVDLADCAVKIQGEQLGIVTMTGQELLIRGSVRLLEILR